jgi:YVTN family beta-propeller protein
LSAAIRTGYEAIMMQLVSWSVPNSPACRWLTALLVSGSVAACGSDNGNPTNGAGGAGGTGGKSGPTIGVTADWLDHRLSVFDFDALVHGATSRDEVLLGEVDLSGYEQGPLELKITADGKTAIVSTSPGFFTVPGSNILVAAPASDIPTGPSKELFVNLESLSVEAELDVGDGPTGIALTRDGTRAFVSHAGSSEVTIIDLKTRQVIEQVDVGGAFAEQIGFDETGTVGIVTCLAGGLSKGARTFSVDDMKGTLSSPIDLASDAAGVPFFPGTKTAYVVLAYNPLSSPTSGYAIIDAASPSAPVMIKRTSFTDATYVNFQALAAPARGTVLVPIALGGQLSVREYSLGADDVVLEDTFDFGTIQGMGAFGMTLDDAGHLVMTLPAEKMLAVLDLNTRSKFNVPWTSQPGPMGIDRH